MRRNPRLLSLDPCSTLSAVRDRLESEGRRCEGESASRSISYGVLKGERSASKGRLVLSWRDGSRSPSAKTTFVFQPCSLAEDTRSFSSGRHEAG